MMITCTPKLYSELLLFNVEKVNNLSNKHNKIGTHYRIHYILLFTKSSLSNEMQIHVHFDSNYAFTYICHITYQCKMVYEVISGTSFLLYEH